MAQNTTRIAGRHFLQIPGPAPVPDRILRAMDRAIIDHRGPEFDPVRAEDGGHERKVLRENLLFESAPRRRLRANDRGSPRKSD